MTHEEWLENLRIFTNASPLYQALDTWYHGPVTEQMRLEAEFERRQDLENFLHGLYIPPSTKRGGS